MRRPIVAGNWKMNTSIGEAFALVDELTRLADSSSSVEQVVIPPYPWIVPLSERLAGSAIVLGAQDCAVEDKGAFTGEVSATMLAPFCTYIIVGHSERRHILKEDEQIVGAKLRAVLRNGVVPILCVGELLDEREQNQATQVVDRQLRSAFDGVAADDARRVVLAYEPVWAIGTGRAATPDDAQEMAAFARAVLTEIYSSEVASAIRIQYGGSVSAGNAGDILTLPDVDGALVGGASLRAAEFASIIASATPSAEASPSE